MRALIHASLIPDQREGAVELRPLPRLTLERTESRYPLLSEANESNDATTSTWPTKDQPNFKKTIHGSLMVVSLIVVINTCLLVWAVSKPDFTDSGSRIIYTGSCDKTKSTLNWIAVFINILSTILLAASNSCAQYISSPTRDEVDRAHAKGCFLDIGVPSIRNLFSIAKPRILLWILLLLSSAPLHLIWNSVFFSTLSARDYVAALVTHDSLQKEFANFTLNKMPGLLDYETSIEAYYQGRTLIQLDNADCLRAYSLDKYESQWGNVLVVTSAQADADVLQVYFHQLEYSVIDDYSTWPCGYDRSGNMKECDVQSIIQNAASWEIKDIGICPITTGTHTCSTDVYYISASIEYCLAEPVNPTCTVEISAVLLGVVLSSNIVKACCLLIALRLRNFLPLATVGDALSSFLYRPDLKLGQVGPVSGVEIRQYHSVKKDLSAMYSGLGEQIWRPKRRFLFSAAGYKRWLISSILIWTVWVAGACLLRVGVSNGAYTSNILKDIFAAGLGFGNSSQFVAGQFAHVTLTQAILLANLPQIIVSFVYLFYNNLFTCMLLTHETLGFALKTGRKPLRCSFPRAGQRGSYFLQLPYRYSLPIMAASILLHFFLSRSIFLVKIVIYDVIDNLVASKVEVGYSLAAIVLSLIVGGVMILSLYGFGLLHTSGRMPLLGSCSFAIAAAAHPCRGELDAATKPVAYGVLQSERAGDRRRVGFSSWEVGELQPGEIYS